MPDEPRAAGDEGSRGVDHERRRFVARAAASLAGARLGLLSPLVQQAACATASARRPLPSFDGATAWLNTSPLSTASLRDHVVLVQFWTFTCINWLRTLAYTRAWKERYGRLGLVTVGVHSPEFEFERDLDAVRREVQRLRVDYPVAVDSDRVIWGAFRNAYWPALYLADSSGGLAYEHFGEGAFERSERELRHLLTNAGARELGPGLTAVEPRGVEADADWSDLRSGETYLGRARTERFASPGGIGAEGRRDYALPARLERGEWALAGAWAIRGEPAVLLEPAGRLAGRFHARDLHLVMGPAARGASVRYRVRLDGRPPGPAHGLDVSAEGEGVAHERRLHQLLRQPAPIEDRTFTIEFLDAGVEAYSLTFG